MPFGALRTFVPGIQSVEAGPGYLPPTPTPDKPVAAPANRAAAPPPPEPSRFKVCLAVSLHVATALSVTLLNKWALGIVPLPQVLLAFQTAICVVLSVVVASCGWGDVGSLKLGLGEARRLSAYLVMRTVGVGMKVWCLHHVPASFYQVSRGLLLPVTVALSYFLLGSRISHQVLAAICVICVGFVVGAGGRPGVASGPGLPWLDLGFGLGLASTFTTALETVVVKIYAPRLSVFRAVYATSLVGFASFTLLSLVSGGLHDFAGQLELAGQPDGAGRTGSRASAGAIAAAIGVSGVAYYLVSLAAVLQISVTTPVTHMISTALRGVLQSVLAVWLLPGEHLGLQSWASIGFILSGSGAYTWAKEEEKRRASFALPVVAPSSGQAEGKELQRSETSVGRGLEPRRW